MLEMMLSNDYHVKEKLKSAKPSCTKYVYSVIKCYLSENTMTESYTLKIWMNADCSQDCAGMEHVRTQREAISATVILDSESVIMGTV